jgi:hypothetical protein
MEKELFDSDKYISSLQSMQKIEVLKGPNNKVPVNNLPKLAPDKKIVPI